jgi:D-beta-D-heptose 7-phosphate kinase/D-beta-D-heptose 1-phosphate adenosyltransferase
MSNNISDSVPRLKRWIPRMRGKRIGVLGDLMLDRYLWGTASRLSPEAAVPVVDFVEQSECLGGAGNVAANIAALGAKVEAFGVIGNDEAGRLLQKCLRVANITDKGVVADSKRVTTLKTRIIARHQQVVRVDREHRELLRPETQEKLLRQLFSALKHLDSLVLSDYDKGLITDDFADRVLSAAIRVQARSLRLYKNRDFQLMRGCTRIAARAPSCAMQRKQVFTSRALSPTKNPSKKPAVPFSRTSAAAPWLSRAVKRE